MKDALPAPPLPQRAAGVAGTLDGVAGAYAALQAVAHVAALLFNDAFKSAQPGLGTFPPHALVFGAITMTVTAVVLVAAWRLARAGVRENDHRVRLGLFAGACAVIGPVGLLWSMRIHGAHWVPLVANAAGTACLLVINGLPLALWWRHLGTGRRLRADACDGSGVVP